MSKQVYTVTKEGIEYVCSLINQIVTLPSDVIDDLNIATNTTYSSYKLNVDLNNLETNINDRTDKLIASLNKLSKKIITAESEIVDENTLYLLLIDSTNNVYQQWLLIDGSPVMVGTTEMSLNSVYTKDESDVKFGLKTVSDTLVTEVTEIKETIGTEDLTTIATTLKGAINELEAKHYLEVYDLQNTSVLDYAKTFNALTHNYFYANNCIDLPDNMNYGYCAVDVSQDPLYRDITFYCPTTGRIYVNTIGADPDDATVFGTWSGWHRHLNDDDIVTTLDDTVTDSQVPSAKAVFNSIDNIQDTLTTLTAVTDLDNFKGSSFMIGRGTGYNNETTNIPNGVNGAFVVEWFPYGNGDLYGVQKITLVQPINNKYVTFERSLDNNNWMGWNKVCSTSVPDVPVTAIKNFKDSNVTNFGNSCYCVENGWCHLVLEIQFSSDGEYGWTNIIDTTVYNIPIPKMLSGTTKAILSTNATSPKTIIVAPQGGGIGVYGHISRGEQYFGSISYPVAEDWQP